MRRILPILVSVVSLWSISSFAVTWNDAEPDCKKPASALAGVCETARQKFCGNKDPNCSKVETPVTSSADALQYCQSDLSNAKTSCDSTILDSLKLPVADKSEGVNDKCDKLKEATTTAKKANQEAAASCRAAVAICEAHCKVAIKSASKIAGLPVAAAGAGAAAGADPWSGGAAPLPGMSADYLPQAQQALSACEGLKASFAQVAEKQMQGDTSSGDIAAICQDNTKEKPDGGKDKDKPGGDSTGKSDSTTAKNGNKNDPMSSMFNPQSMMALAQALMKKDAATPTDPTALQQPQMPQMQDCSQNQNLAGCVPTAPQAVTSWNTAATGDATPVKDATGSAGTFNPAEAGDTKTASVDGPPQQFGTPPTYQGISNGGGQMLGNGGGGASPASLGGGQGGAAAGGPGKKVELTTSGGGGGYSQTAAGMKMTSGESGGGYTYGGRNPAGNDNNDFNLAQFLPGHEKDPFKGRGVAGAGTGTGNFQIQSKDVNLFSRISERIKARCAQGLLRDCIP